MSTEPNDLRGGPDARPAEQVFKRTIRHVMDQREYLRKVSAESPLFPRQVLIEPTNACNLRCVHCHHHQALHGRKALTRKVGIMNMNIYRKAIDELAELQAAVSLNVQGEPTLHPGFADMVRYAKSKGVHTSVLSNGTRMTEPLARALVEMRLDRMVFSFDAVDKSIYESIRVRAKFPPTLRNILTFIRINHESGHPAHVCMSMVLQQRNRRHGDAYERYFNRLPVDKIFRNPLLNLAGASGVKEEIDLRQLQVGPRENWPICRVPWEDLTVNWDGEVCPCPVDVNVVFPVGNVQDAALREIWNNQRMQVFRRAHLTRAYHAVEEKGPLCGSCNCLWDADYDLQRYDEYAVEAIYRSAVQFAHHFTPRPPLEEDEKYKNLLEELGQLEPALMEAQ